MLKNSRFVIQNIEKRLIDNVTQDNVTLVLNREFNHRVGSSTLLLEKAHNPSFQIVERLLKVWYRLITNRNSVYVCECMCVHACVCVFIPPKLMDLRASNLARMITTPCKCHKEVCDCMMTSQLKATFLKLHF